MLIEHLSANSRSNERKLAFETLVNFHVFLVRAGRVDVFDGAELPGVLALEHFPEAAFAQRWFPVQDRHVALVDFVLLEGLRFSEPAILLFQGFGALRWTPSARSFGSASAAARLRPGPPLPHRSPPLVREFHVPWHQSASVGRWPRHDDGGRFQQLVVGMLVLVPSFTTLDSLILAASRTRSTTIKSYGIFLLIESDLWDEEEMREVSSAIGQLTTAILFLYKERTI